MVTDSQFQKMENDMKFLKKEVEQHIGADGSGSWTGGNGINDAHPLAGNGRSGFMPYEMYNWTDKHLGSPAITNPSTDIKTLADGLYHVPNNINEAPENWNTSAALEIKSFADKTKVLIWTYTPSNVSFIKTLKYDGTEQPWQRITTYQELYRGSFKPSQGSTITFQEAIPSGVYNSSGTRLRIYGYAPGFVAFSIILVPTYRSTQTLSSTQPTDDSLQVVSSQIGINLTNASITFASALKYLIGNDSTGNIITANNSPFDDWTIVGIDAIH
ncbi:hypothetical protein FC19_GL001431 [Liquorilactobacillus aquaticus DSM 21051]|uniref:Uncharacterized protein n=1 Tax=Liquorilactobacillus aquaticus DSM 21051 TaxID=1423725 RepID=A0A0R2CVW3_9LACO|nr:hypothetical protein [Liquorilactobacillus aquaticus]KRM95950.1 hypothetical protein FC19_GL001431 [Liquorilactobacillus aquaticus DSM 21051]